MIRHFKIWFVALAVILVALVVVFSASIYFNSCSYRDNCRQGGRARLAHTPIPTLNPAGLAANALSYPVELESENCSVMAEALLSAWVTAGFSEKDYFNFVDANNTDCAATFVDLQPLFTQGNLWYPGALACSSCHNADLGAASAQLDLSSYAGILAGSRRTAGSAQGEDILGNGNWEASRLYQVLFVLKQMPPGRPADASLEAGPMLYAGIPAEVAYATPTTTPAPEEIARPTNQGGPGEAVNLQGDAARGVELFKKNCLLCHGDEGKDDVLNPGTGDGTVPALNPIDETLIDPDYKIYAFNLDLFLENGSTPEGPNPARLMPAWGAKMALAQQEIADLIAYIISLNK